jgi:small redox-active disulfide protein 2
LSNTPGEDSKVNNLEILRTGCAKCKRLEKNIQEVVAGLDIEVVKVSNINEIASRGAMITPRLVIDGEIVALGRVPSVDEIKSMISSN